MPGIEAEKLEPLMQFVPVRENTAYELEEAKKETGVRRRKEGARKKAGTSNSEPS